MNAKMVALIQEVERELIMRDWVYNKRISTSTMTKAEAAVKIKLMEDVRAALVAVGIAEPHLRSLRDRLNPGAASAHGMFKDGDELLREQDFRALNDFVERIR